MSLLSYRDAFADHAGISSETLFRSDAIPSAPRLSITIPTFRRPELLLETVASAADQITDIPYEIVIVDNDSTGEGFAAVRRQLEAMTTAPLRYHINSDNLGMFGNWNRCITLAAAPWVSILNDDDLLYPDFVAAIFAKLDRHPTIDGIVCRQAEYYRDSDRTVPDPTTLKTRLRSKLQGMRFDRHGLMRITPRTLFFGNDLRNSLGFVFRKDAAVATGGYRPEEFPAADYLFYVRFAMHHTLYWFHRTLAAIGIGANESMKVETALRYTYQCAELREALAGEAVPAHWIRMQPTLTGFSMTNMERVWGIQLDWEEAERVLGFAVPRAGINTIRRHRLRYGGY